MEGAGKQSVLVLQFLCPCPLKERMQSEKHGAVLVNRNFIKQSELKYICSPKEESGWLEVRSSPAVKKGFSEWWKVPPCVLHCLIDKVIHSFRLYIFSSVCWHLSRVTQAKLMGCMGGKNIILIYYKYGIMNLSHLESPLSSWCMWTKQTNQTNQCWLCFWPSTGAWQSLELGGS